MAFDQPTGHSCFILNWNNRLWRENQTAHQGLFLETKFTLVHILRPVRTRTPPCPGSVPPNPEKTLTSPLREPSICSPGKVFPSSSSPDHWRTMWRLGLRGEWERAWPSFLDPLGSFKGRSGGDGGGLGSGSPSLSPPRVDYSWKKKGLRKGVRWNMEV